MDFEEKFIEISEHPTPKPENNSEKEVYSFFGLASYTAQALEKGLVTLAFSYSLGKREILSEEEWDLLFGQVNGKTFGVLLKLVKAETSIDHSMLEKLDFALSKRNWLAHDYFYDRAEEFCSNRGRENMLSELSNLIKIFNFCDQFIEGIVKHIWEHHGITENDIEVAMNRLVETST